MKGMREGAERDEIGAEDRAERRQHLRVPRPEATNVLTPAGGWFSTQDDAAKGDVGRDPRSGDGDVSGVPVLHAGRRSRGRSGGSGRTRSTIATPTSCRAASETGVRQRLYFDAESGLLVRRVLLRSTSLGDVPQQIDYSDYRDAGGFKLPYTVRIASIAPWNDSAHVFSEIHPNAKVNEKVFEMPKP